MNGPLYGKMAQEWNNKSRLSMIVWVSVVLKRTSASEIDGSIICAEVIARVKVNCDILYYQLLVFSL